METDFIDMPRFEERMEGDRELIREVFAVFLEEVPERRAKFEKALAGMDVDALTLLAHSLKGASGTLQAEPLRQACFGLEHAARSKDVDKIKEFAPLVIAVLDQTAEFMRQMQPTL